MYSKIGFSKNLDFSSRVLPFYQWVALGDNKILSSSFPCSTQITDLPLHHRDGFYFYLRFYPPPPPPHPSQTHHPSIAMKLLLNFFHTFDLHFLLLSLLHADPPPPPPSLSSHHYHHHHLLYHHRRHHHPIPVPHPPPHHHHHHPPPYLPPHHKFILILYYKSSIYLNSQRECWQELLTERKTRLLCSSSEDGLTGRSKCRKMFSLPETARP